MNKELKDYMNGKTNVVRNEFIISREKNSNGELIFVNTPNTETPMYALWNSKKLTKTHKIKERDGKCVIEKAESKGTGGEHAYLMLMQREINRTEGLSLEASGLLLKLFPYLEWNTCRLIDNRAKKSLTRQMIAEKVGVGFRRANIYLSELTKRGFLEYRNKSYYLNKAFIRKGRNCED